MLHENPLLQGESGFLSLFSRTPSPVAINMFEVAFTTHVMKNLYPIGPKLQNGCHGL